MTTINPLQGNNPLTEKALQDPRLNKGEKDFQAVLKKVQNEQDDRELMAACQEMEAIFINQLLRQMRATVPKSTLVEESLGSSIYKDMLDTEYSKLISKSPQNFGLAAMLYKQLKRDMDIQKAATTADIPDNESAE